MHITCVICSDLFTPSSDLYSTPCGHLFHYTCLLHWLENSKTCPQCRAKVSSKSLIRLFVNVAHSHDIGQDITLLQHKLENMEFSMKLKDKECKNVVSKSKEVEDQNKALREHVKELELADRRYESIVAALKEQIKYFKEQAQNSNRLKNDLTKLRTELKNLEHVQIAICASRQQVEQIIQNESNIDSLALLAATLKKTLVDTEQKKLKLQHDYKKTQHELSQCKRELMTVKCEQEDTKKQLASLKLNYEREVKYLKEKFSQLKAKEPFRNDSLNNSIRMIVNESPVNYTRKRIISPNENHSSLIDLSESFTPPRSDRSHTPPLDMPHKKVRVSKLKDEAIDESPLPASTMSLFGLQRAKSASQSNSGNNKFSIFKNKELQSDSVPSTSRSTNPEVIYNGLGGSSKDDVFPSSSVKRPKPFKHSKSKLKKLSADAGKSNKKVSEFLVDLS